MPAFAQLPWMGGADQFFQAMLAGADDRRKREALQEQASEASGRLQLGYANLDREAEASRARQAQSEAEQAALGQYRNAQLEDADQRLAIQGARLKTAQNANSPWQVFSLGKGEVARVNKLTGEIETVQKPHATSTEPQITVPVYPPGVDIKTAGLLGIRPVNVRGTAASLPGVLGTNTPAFLQQPGMAADATAKQSLGGYQVGRRYQGMTYLGGDPHDEKNWQK